MIYHGLVFVGADDGYLYALDEDGFSDGDQGITDSSTLPADGDVVWKTDLGSAVGYSTCTISKSQANLYVGTTAGKLYALDLYTGAVNWTYTAGGAIQSTPSIFEDVIIVGCNDSKLYVFDLNGFSDGDDGDIDSDTSSSAGDVIGIVTLGGSAGRSSPAFDPSGEFVYIGTDTGKFHSISSITGEINWTYDAGASIDSSPAVGDLAVYFTVSTGQLIALGKEREGTSTQPKLFWNFTSQTGAGMLSSPAVYGNRVFVADEDGRVYALGAPNAAPKAVISSPLNQSQYFDYEDITFDGSESSDPDDTTLYYIWSARRETQSTDTIIYSGTVPIFTTNFSSFKGANYIITLTVRDTLGASDSATVNITIFSTDDDGPERIRRTEFCEPLIPACCFISVGGPGQVTMSATSNPGKSSDVNLSVKKFVSFRYAEILNQDYIIEWTNITIGFKLLDLMYDMNASRIRMYYWDDDWIKLPNSGVTFIDSENAEVWANFTDLISPTPVIFAPGTFDNNPPTVTTPVDGVLVEPTTGREIDDFTFKVLYRDLDSDPIHDGGWVKVFIDGNPFLMEEENKGTSDYGTYVTFIATLKGKDIGLGPHSISFAAHDGTIRSLELLQTSLDLNISASSPNAEAGADRTVSTGKSFNVDGSGSTDPDGDIINYYWDFDSTVDRNSDGDYTNDRDKEGIETSWSYSAPGTYTITLTVVDSTGSEDSDTINVIVVPKIDGDDGEESDLGAAITAIGIGIMVIILALIIAFLFMHLKKKEMEELDRISAGELPLRRPTVKRIKRRRLGEEEEEEEEEDEQLPEGEDLDEFEDGTIPEERRLMPGEDEDEFEFDEDQEYEGEDTDEYEEDDEEEDEVEFEDDDEADEDEYEDEIDAEDEDIVEFDDEESE
jgi:outer membrane protein assembly factor BamB